VAARFALVIITATVRTASIVFHFDAAALWTMAYARRMINMGGFVSCGRTLDFHITVKWHNYPLGNLPLVKRS
jgi:hypothetical protein